MLLTLWEFFECYLESIGVFWYHLNKVRSFIHHVFSLGFFDFFSLALIFDFIVVFDCSHAQTHSSISLELTSKKSWPMVCWCVHRIAQKSKLQKVSRLSPNSTRKNELEFSELDHISPHHFWLPPMFFHLFVLTESCSYVQVQIVLNLDHYVPRLTSLVPIAI